MANIQDVAKAAGVSTATVSRVINSTGYVKTETRQRVLKVIETLGFYPSVIGQNLRRSRTNIVMVIIHEITNPFIAEVVRSIEFTARQNGFSVLLHEYRGNDMTAQQMEGYISSRKIDGMIFLTAQAKLREFERISSKSPTVLAGEYVDHLDIPSVSIDNIAATMDVMQYLITLGHRNILFINGETDNISCRDRLRGYRIALDQAGIIFQPSLVLESAPRPDSAWALVTAALAGGLSFTAVFCVSDVLATGAMKAIRDHNLRIPEDMSIVGFDDIEFARFMEPPLTTVYQPAQAIGETAMKLWLKIYAGEPIEYPVKLQHELRIRSSCAKVPY